MKWDGLFRNLELQAQTLAISSSDLVSGARTLAKVADKPTSQLISRQWAVRSWMPEAIWS